MTDPVVNHAALPASNPGEENDHNEKGEPTGDSAEHLGTLTELLKGVLDTLHESESFSVPSKDPETRVWRAYERVAKEYDEEFLERHNTSLDSLLIFAGLFSAVSSAFLVQA
ncbi:hypothetical protein M422DRAFT_247314 [Sphaerobolus stellatus SS14]|nr:hypothetical protein M422DRAFT_247314 [Sphaerobolus stellatus SS14]